MGQAFPSVSTVRGQIEISFRKTNLISGTGSAARIVGTNNLVLRGDVADIDWDCILDGRTVPREPYFPETANNWWFCTFSDLVAGAHTIGLRVKTSGRSFLFDQIQFMPSGIVEGEVVAAARDDANLQYSSGWEPWEGLAHLTLVRGSTATFRFNGKFNAFLRVVPDTVLILALIAGTGVSLWAVFPENFPQNPGDATYTLDGGSAVNFIIPGGGAISQFNRRIFEISGLSPGIHTITLQYTSGGSSTPLVVERFLIEGGTNLRAPAANTTTELPDIGPGSLEGTGSSGPTGTPNKPGPSLPGSGQVPVGAIVGAIIGALILINLVVGVVWLRKRRRIRLQKDSSPARSSMPARFEPFVPPHPSVQSKRGPVFDSRYISNYDSYLDTAPFADSTHRLDTPPNTNNHNSPASPASAATSAPLPPSSHTPPSPTAQAQPLPLALQPGNGQNPKNSGFNIPMNEAPSSNRSRAVFHEDSGIRLRPGAAEEDVVEYPPMYSKL
ncbi:hypothetical protein EST38_g2418 [Candolleomyces aberdarensis]|uniref:Uncharacterized protein n=1 Tax=Candolleomyces aberdarensis TaxID=2316362 RepID=A0A4Q2DUP1_9AGAR|nr:hypothetical protein EST38_g2418 [Candolleomyces aberdarensis]